MCIVVAGGLSLDSLDLTEPPRKDHMSLSRDSGLTLSDCQLFIPESPVGSEDSAVNASTSSFDKSITKDEKTSNGKTYIRAYNHHWEERYASGTHTHNGVEHSYPNPNFQRQDWLRAQLKRTPRTKLEEHDQQRKERFDEKDLYTREFHRQEAIKEIVDNRKEVYRSSQINVSCDIRNDYERSSQQDVRLHESEQNSTDTSLSNSERYELKKERFGDFKKVKSELYVNRESPISQNGSYHSASDCHEFSKVRSELYINKTESRSERYEFDKSSDANNIYGNRDTVNDIYGTRGDRSDIYQFKQAETVDVYDEEDETDAHERTWPDTPPPLPPRLRHLPPVHMSLEDRHKIAGRSRSLPPPPPYRPPPQPRAPITTTRYLGHSRSVVDDESYV